MLYLLMYILFNISRRAFFENITGRTDEKNANKAAGELQGIGGATGKDINKVVESAVDVESKKLRRAGEGEKASALEHIGRLFGYIVPGLKAGVEGGVDLTNSLVINAVTDSYRNMVQEVYNTAKSQGNL